MKLSCSQRHLRVMVLFVQWLPLTTYGSSSYLTTMFFSFFFNKNQLFLLTLSPSEVRPIRGKQVRPQTRPMNLSWLEDSELLSLICCIISSQLTVNLSTALVKVFLLKKNPPRITLLLNKPSKLYVALQKAFLWFLKIATSNKVLNEKKDSCLRFQNVDNLCRFSALILFMTKRSTYFFTKPWKAQLSINTGQY